MRLPISSRRSDHFRRHNGPYQNISELHALFACLPQRGSSASGNSGPVNAAHIAAAPGVMRVDIIDLRIGEKALDDAFDRLALDHIGIESHAVLVESPERQKSELNDVRQCNDPAVGL